MDPQDFIFLVFGRKFLTENNSNLGTYGSGNLLTCGAVAQRHVARDRLRSWASPCQQQIAQRLSPWPRHGQVPDASTMGRNVGLLPGVGDTEILWWMSWVGCAPTDGLALFFGHGARARSCFMQGRIRLVWRPMLPPGPIAYAVTAPQALHVNMWTEPLYGVECVYTVSPQKNSSGPFTDVGFKSPEAGPKNPRGTLPLCGLARGPQVRTVHSQKGSLKQFQSFP